MPSPQELAKIIAEMRSQGLTKDEILETLRDMGVPDDAIAQALGGEFPGPSAAPSASPAVSAPAPASVPAQQSPSQPQQPKGATPRSEDDLFAPSPAPAKDVLSELMTAGPSTASREQESPQAESTSQPSSPAPAQSLAPSPPSQPLQPRDDFSSSVATPPILEEESVPSEKLDEIHQKVDALHRALSSSDSIRDDVAEVKEMLREIKRELHDVRSMFSAIQHLLQQILETDRSILVDLYEKAKK